MAKNPYSDAEALHLDAMAFFKNASVWSVNGQDGLTLEQQMATKPGAAPHKITPMGWIAWSKFDKWDDFRAVTLDQDVAMQREARWIDNILQKGAQSGLLAPDTKNARGLELVCSTLWGYSVKQTIDAGHNQDVIQGAAMEMAKGIPQDDRGDYVDRFNATCLLGLGLKR